VSPENENGRNGLDAVPGLARIAASAWWHTSGWAVRTSLSTARRAAELATSPDKAVELARDLLGEVPTDQRPSGESTVPASTNGRPVARTLREEGEQLLRKSRDVHYEIDAHPAYERILTELAPDEGRILRLLLLDGPQPTVDVRTGGPVGLVRSRLIAPGLSMIGARAGCRYVERVPSYLNNLFRLGLIWFSRETLRDPLRYQVLEAQPDVLEAIHSVRQAKVVRRSIHLTPFGEDFCRVCLCGPETVLDGLPAHSSPPQTTNAPQPPTELVDD
jgi:Abortive infection alpha